MADLLYWCASCGRVSILAEVAKFGVGTAPYMRPGCVIVEGDKITIAPDKNDVKPYSQARKEPPSVPEVPTRGQTYRLQR